MMEELVQIKEALQPSEVLLVADAMTGQEAVRVAEEFNTAVRLSGLILTKMDGDARGGAALSIRWVTGVPIKFIGTGEKVDAFEPFYPDRLASRILGMGDMLTLIERAEASLDEKRAKELEKRMRTSSLNLEDFLEQLRQIKKMGPLSQLVEMIPGFSHLARQAPAGADEKQIKKLEAIILSMTPQERRNPHIINGSRRRRIAHGSGTTPQDVNQLLNQFHQMQKLAKQLDLGKTRQLLSALK
jgi:signal recognition particle subunit SRP54